MRAHWSRSLFITVALVALANVALPSRALASTITINYPFDNSGYVGNWGPDPIQRPQTNLTFAELFTAPGPILLDYSLTSFSAPQTFPFVSEIFQWNGSQIVGPALYESAVQQTTSSVTTYIFSPNINLTAGDQYVALVTNSPNGVSLGGSAYGVMQLSTYAVAGAGVGYGFMYTSGQPVRLLGSPLA